MLEHCPDEIKQKLEQLAIKRSRPFCYSCYIPAGELGDERGKCSRCGSDDNMREYPGAGVEYCTDWIYESIIKTEGERVSISGVEDEMRDMYYHELRQRFPDYRHGAMWIDVADAILESNNWMYEQAAEGSLIVQCEDGELFHIDGEFYRFDLDAALDDNTTKEEDNQ